MIVAVSGKCHGKIVENSTVRKRQLELELNLDYRIMLLSIGSLNALYMRMIIMYPTLLSFVH